MRTYNSIPRPVTPEQIPSLTAPELLEDLFWMPIFRLSLSSKELFHSNFLEFLWMSDPSAFIQMIRNLLGDEEALPDGNDYYLDREKENFDICIYHLVDDLNPRRRKKAEEDPNVKPQRVVYDLIIENKVKSIPYKEQLVKYVERVERKRREADSRPKYLLFSLAEVFPDKTSQNEVAFKFIIKKGRKTEPGSVAWKVVDYLTLYNEIQTRWKDSEGSSYISDYCKFIYRLHFLQKAILNTMGSEHLFKEYEKFKEHRLHDLYIKLRCTKFMMQLRNRLMKSIPVEILAANLIREKDKTTKQYRNKAGVYLNVNVFNAVGQVGALIWDGKGDIYEVVIQGEQYRHGINPREKETGKDKRDMLDKMWNRHLNDPRANQFLNKVLNKVPHECKNKDKAGPYNEYDDAYIYRYVNYKDLVQNVEQLLDVMAQDIVATYNTLNP